MKKITLKSLTAFLFFLTFAVASSLYMNHDALAKINNQEARQIALRHSGVSKDRANFDKVDFDKGKHGGVYEVNFHTPNRRFFYTISAESGRVLSHSVQNKQPNKR